MPRTGFENSVVDTLYFAARPEQAGQFSKWSRYAQRQGSRERTLRNRPAPLQAHLREGRRARRNPQARVLRKADPGTQAQARCGGEASSAPVVARSDASRTALLRSTRLHAFGRPARARRLFAFLAPRFPCRGMIR